MLIRSRLQRGQGRRRIEQELGSHLIDVSGVARRLMRPIRVNGPLSRCT